MNEKAARWYKVSVKSSKKQSKLKILQLQIKVDLSLRSMREVRKNQLRQ